MSHNLWLILWNFSLQVYYHLHFENSSIFGYIHIEMQVCLSFQGTTDKFDADRESSGEPLPYPSQEKIESGYPGYPNSNVHISLFYISSFFHFKIFKKIPKFFWFSEFNLKLTIFQF